MHFHFNFLFVQGDSGGPLVIRDSLGQWMQVGLVSYGAASGCENGYPDVFTRLTKYINWIKDVVNLSAVPTGRHQGLVRQNLMRRQRNPNKLSLKLKKVISK
jgi:secreted trypsin-like serine protease